jgi:hypothetical protein
VNRQWELVIGLKSTRRVTQRGGQTRGAIETRAWPNRLNCCEKELNICSEAASAHTGSLRDGSTSRNHVLQFFYPRLIAEEVMKQFTSLLAAS